MNKIYIDPESLTSEQLRVSDMDSVLGGLSKKAVALAVVIAAGMAVAMI